MDHGRTRVYVASCGVGIAQRGFETLARDCFAALRGQADIDVTLVKGRGSVRAAEFPLPTLRRDGRVARKLGDLLGREAYFAEQMSFASAMLPLVAVRRPHVLYVSEWWVAKALVRWRPRVAGSYRVVLSNGGPYPPHRLDWADHVHQLTPTAFDLALRAGIPRERQTQLPLGIDLDRVPPPPADRRRLRESLALPPERPIVLAVAALAVHHKRLDYLVRELARLTPPRPFLVMLGQVEDETPRLLSLADELLGPGGFVARTVPTQEVASYYNAADVFVHVSLWEAFGRVLVEALAHGLACVTHDGPTQRYLLEDHAVYGDLRRDGALAELLPGAIAAAPAGASARREHVRERYGWGRLAPLYADMLRTAAVERFRGAAAHSNSA